MTVVGDLCKLRNLPNSSCRLDQVSVEFCIYSFQEQIIETKDEIKFPLTNSLAR